MYIKSILLISLFLLTSCEFLGLDKDNTLRGTNNTPPTCESGIYVNDICVEEPTVEEPPIENCGTFPLSPPKTTISGIYPPNGFLMLETYGSPYRIDDSIQIPDGYKLTIMPGVEIQCGKIEVFGTLHIAGSEDNPVILNDVIVDAPYKEAALNNLLETSLTTISHAHFYGYNSRVSIFNNRATVEDSIFQRAALIGFVPHDYSDITIERNIFLNSGGIHVDAKFNAKTIIRNNYFYNQRGFGNEGDDIYAIQSSDTYGNLPTIVEYNSFASTNLIAVTLREHGNSVLNMTAYNNYWGTTDITTIEQMIYDANDDSSLNLYIPHNPYLLDHHVDTPVPADENGDGIPDILWDKPEWPWLN